MKIAVGCDHAGFPLRASVMQWVKSLGHEVIDCGNTKNDPQDDYPDFSLAVAKSVATGQADKGIMLCGSAVGATVACNKVVGVRACCCHDTYSAAQGVEHDDMNVLTLGGRIVGVAVAELLVKAFVNAKFSGEARHVRRLEKVKAIEAGKL